MKKLKEINLDNYQGMLGAGYEYLLSLLPHRMLGWIGMCVFLLGGAKGIFSQNINNSVNQKQLLEHSLLPVVKSRPNDYKTLAAPDSLGVRKILKNPSTTDKTSIGVHLPYPVIFIHGLASNSATWDQTTDFMDTQYSLTFGGRFDFCLNYDGNNLSANKNFWPTANADLALYTDPSDSTQIIAGDYYYVNFDVGIDGSVFPSTSNSNYVLSNQQSIVKQGKALAYAIYYVLQKTGRNKIVLMGHSMGGLASREYIQNWVQSDGTHHVAKLTTTGTPHKGSNSTSFGLPVSVVDEHSEAIRDLRRTYYYSLDSGIYLYGGWEYQGDNNHMDDNVNAGGDDFYNVDVNCNGIEGDTILGLNKKSISQDLDYACIIGECSGCLDGFEPSDGVVRSIDAKLNLIYNLNVNPTFNLFYYNTSGTIEIHTDLPAQNYMNMQGLDEPNEYVLGYQIGFDTTYLGFTTVQPAGGYYYDYDCYKFSVTNQSNLNVIINNIDLADMAAHIVDVSGNTVGSVAHSNGSTSLNFTQLLSAGDYYLEIYGVPTFYSYLYPYSFIINQTVVTTISESSIQPSNLLIYPNPASTTININGINSHSLIKIYNMLGTQIFETVTDNNLVIDTKLFNQGVYTIIIQNVNGLTSYKVIITN